MLARNLHMIAKAVTVAESSEYRWKLGAVIARGNRIISLAPNKFRNSPWVDCNNATVHAEQACIKGC